METDIIAEVDYDILGETEKLHLSIEKPWRDESNNCWTCVFSLGAPFNYCDGIHGETSLQALILAIKAASVTLYSSELYRQKKLGLFGEFGKDLSIPASKEFLDIAPYPL